MTSTDAFWKHRLVCVTGGSGFLGYHLVRQLLSKEARVRVLCLEPGANHPLRSLDKVECVFGDLLDTTVVRRALADCEVVFHTAGLVAVWGPALRRMHSVHVEGTRNVLAAAPARARIVHTSSVVAVGAGRDGQILSEESRFNLQNIRIDYVHAKRQAEEIALEEASRGKHVVVVNPGYLVGPEDHEPSVMGRLCQRFWKGRLLMAPPGGLNLVDVRDAARGHLQAAVAGQPGRRYILGGENHDLHTFLGMLAQAAGWNPRALPRVPHWFLLTAAALGETRALWSGKEPYPSFQHARLNRFDFFYQWDRARTELGYTARPLVETLADTFRWHQQHGLAPLRGRLNHWWFRPQQTALKR